MKLQQAFNRVLEFFEGDKDKAHNWFATKNPSLGNVSPLEMIKKGREKKLIMFINKSLDENYKV